jgi:hypothetical protein
LIENPAAPLGEGRFDQPRVAEDVAIVVPAGAILNLIGVGDGDLQKPSAQADEAE